MSRVMLRAVLPAVALLAGCFMSLDENRWKHADRGPARDLAAVDARLDRPLDLAAADAKPDAPTPDAPRGDGPGTDAKKPDGPKTDSPKPDAKKTDGPKPDTKKTDGPKPDLLKPDTKKLDAPRPDLPKPDLPRPDLPGNCATMSLNLQAAADDGELWPPADYFPDGETISGAQNVIFLGHDNTTLWGYFRFTLTQAIAAGSTIASATLTLFGEGSWQWGSNKALDIRAELASSAAAVTGIADMPGTPGTGRPLTGALVRWPASGGLPWTVGADNATPNLAAILQEVVNAKAGLASGSHLQLWIRGSQVAGGAVRTPDFKAPGYANHPARLSLTFCK